jgi:protein-disulfide isomerase
VPQDGDDLEVAPAKSDHVRGSLDAPVVIVEYADFECPYCGQAAPVIKAMEKRYGDKVAVVFRHFPLSMHPHALDAAEAAEEAGAHGKFWEMHDTLFEHQQHLGRSDLGRYGEAVGVKAAAIEQAITAKTHLDRILSDRESGEDSDIPGTPALFINGFAYDEPVTEEALAAAIDYVLTQVKTA